MLLSPATCWLPTPPAILKPRPDRRTSRETDRAFRLPVSLSAVPGSFSYWFFCCACLSLLPVCLSLLPVSFTYLSCLSVSLPVSTHLSAIPVVLSYLSACNTCLSLLPVSLSHLFSALPICLLPFCLSHLSVCHTCLSLPHLPVSPTPACHSYQFVSPTFLSALPVCLLLFCLSYLPLCHTCLSLLRVCLPYLWVL